MRYIVIFGIGATIGAVAMFAAFEYHVVQSSDGLVVVPKTQAALNDVIVDVREWTVTDWNSHPNLAMALIENGHADLVRQSVSNGLLHNLFQRIENRASSDTDLESQQL